AANLVRPWFERIPLPGRHGELSCQVPISVLLYSTADGTPGHGSRGTRARKPRDKGTEATRPRHGSPPLVPSPPSSGERVRVRGLLAGREYKPSPGSVPRTCQKNLTQRHQDTEGVPAG